MRASFRVLRNPHVTINDEQEATAPLVRLPSRRRTASPGMLPDDGGGGGANGAAGGAAGEAPVLRGRRALLDRAISLTAVTNGEDPSAAAAVAAARLNRTSSPATKSRWKHSRFTLLGSRRRHKEKQQDEGGGGGGGERKCVSEAGVTVDCLPLGHSPPYEEPPLDSLERYDHLERAVPEELRVRICREEVECGLVEAMRAAAGGPALFEFAEALAPEEALDALSGRSRLELNLLLLWAALHKRRALLPALLKAGASLDHVDAEGFSALHLAAFSGCSDSVRFLLEQGADANLLRGKYTPLHSAAFGNAPNAARMLLDAGAVVEYYRRSNGRAADGTALHSAVKANATECLKLLLAACEDVNSVAPTGCSALHLAADLGRVDCLNILLAWDGIDLEVKTSERQCTALHLAAENGLGECVALLLAAGADAGATNARGQTPLHLAARAQSVECVEALLRATAGDANATDADMRTPLHAAVGKALQAYEVAETLLSWRADPNARDRYGYTPLHVAALNEQAQCVEAMLRHGADVTARTRGGSTALAILVRKTPAALATLYQRFDAAISMHDPEVSHREVELRLDFRQLLQHSDRGEISYLKTFVDEGQKELLKHPLCEAFLYLKWAKIRKFYIVKLIFCFLFVLFLTLYVMPALAHNCLNESNANGTDDNSTNNITFCKPEGVGKFFHDNPNFIRYEWFVLLFFTLCELFRKIFGIGGFGTMKEYVTQVENILEWFVILSVFAISYIYHDRTYTWQNHVGAFAVMFGWWNFMHMLGQLPLLGSYVAMYSKVQHEFLKLFAAYLCLLIGFTISFCIIFPRRPEFANPLIGFIKVLVMMTGELEFQDLLISEETPTLLDISAHVIFIIFLLFVTVVLMNLLVGIAVHDIQGLQKTAGLLKLEQQTRLISYVELALFNSYVPHYLQNAAMVSPSAYRVVVHVKPLNPREKRLPRNILRSAYELAKQRKLQKKHGTLASRFSSTTASTFTTGAARSTFSDGTLYSSASTTVDVQNICSGMEGGAKAIAKLTEEVGELRSLVEMQQTVLQELLQVVKKQKESDC